MITPNIDAFEAIDWLGPSKATEICVGGAGGIGSWLLLALSRISPSAIHLYEFDHLENRNLGGQFYTIKQASDKLAKADAIIENIHRFVGDVDISNLGKYEQDSGVTPFTFTGFDNMAARRAMFEDWKQLEDRELFIDGRMLPEQFMIYTVIKGEEEEYERSLYSDEEAEDAPCNLKATTHIGMICGAMMVCFYTQYLRCLQTGMDYRTLIPFEYQFNAMLC